MEASMRSVATITTLTSYVTGRAAIDRVGVTRPARAPGCTRPPPAEGGCGPPPGCPWPRAATTPGCCCCPWAWRSLCRRRAPDTSRVGMLGLHAGLQLANIGLQSLEHKVAARLPVQRAWSGRPAAASRDAAAASRRAAA
eukprot:scaffold86816_cov58-Phaeocystis_antarctica.AAC.9